MWLNVHDTFCFLRSEHNSAFHQRPTPIDTASTTGDWRHDGPGAMEAGRLSLQVLLNYLNKEFLHINHRHELRKVKLTTCVLSFRAADIEFKKMGARLIMQDAKFRSNNNYSGTKVTLVAPLRRFYYPDTWRNAYIIITYLKSFHHIPSL